MIDTKNEIMFNPDFLQQIEEFHRYLFEGVCLDEEHFGHVREAAEEAHRMGYVPPADIGHIPCYEGPNGEFVPLGVALGDLEKGL